MAKKVTVELLKKVVNKALAEGKSIAVVATEFNTNANALFALMAEDSRVKDILDDYKAKKNGIDEGVKHVFKEVAYERFLDVVVGKYVTETTKKEVYEFDKEGNRKKTREEIVEKVRYIPPHAESVLKIVSSIGFLKGEKEMASGTVKAIVETIKAFQANKISQDSFITIINNMPIAEEEAQKIINDVIISASSEEPSFEIRTNTHIGWGAVQLDEQINADSDEKNSI